VDETRGREDDLIRRRDRSPTREESALRHSHRQQRQEEPPAHRDRDHGGGHGRTLQQQQHSPSTTARPALITTDEGPMNREANFSFLRSQSSPQRFGVTDLGRVSSKYIECTLTPHSSHTPHLHSHSHIHIHITATHRKKLRSIVFNPQAPKFFATTSLDGSVALWELTPDWYAPTPSPSHPSLLNTICSEVQQINRVDNLNPGTTKAGYPQDMVPCFINMVEDNTFLTCVTRCGVLQERSVLCVSIPQKSLGRWRTR